MFRSLVTCSPLSPFYARNSVGLRALQVRSVMVNNSEILERVEKRAKEAEELVELLKDHLQSLQKAADKQQLSSSQVKIDSLKRDNERLKVEAAKLKKELEYWEIRNGLPQIALPSSGAATPMPVPPTATPTPAVVVQPQPQEEEKKKDKKAEKKGKEKAEKPKKPAEEISVSRLDFRIGKIKTIKKHPDADSLFVEEIDVGEENPRTICSGLVGHIDMATLQEAMVVIMCNLKPVKMRGIVSQGMVMCAANKDSVWSVVVPPPGVVPGDRVVFEGYPGDPDQQLNPKKKVWETLAPDLKTDSEGVPNYKGVPFSIRNKGICTANGIKDGVVR